MTVAAVILASPRGIAITPVDGLPNARRLADVAWAGGALPIVVVALDPDGSVAAALAGSPALVAAPAPETGGPVAQIARGMDVARAEIDGTDAALVWPARMGWVDAETVTTLIEMHGADRAAVLRPSFRGERGWPALVPVQHLEVLRGLGADRGPAEILDDLAAAGLPVRSVEVGDPGTVKDLDTPRGDLPPFEGPPEPEPDRQHEWGSPAAAGPDEVPDPARAVG